MKREPLATYRVQLHAGFDFDAAARVVGYLAELGVSHLYCSPCLQAAPGSAHGYDVVDPTRVNEDLGGAAAFGRLCAALREHDMGLLLDVVPNHMAITRDNPWWWDVLENGPYSRYASYFDVDWEPPGSMHQDKILLPVLHDHYGRVLEAHELVLEREAGAFRLRYRDNLFPIAPDSLHRVLDQAARRCGSDTLAFLSSALAWLPVLAAGADDPARRHRDKEVLRAQLERLLREAPETAGAVDTVIAETNADVDALDALLERQHYRLAFWRTAGQELGYRRFFDINDLIGLRAEREHVLLDSHALVFEWIAADMVDGLRIDHPDGLRDPEGYFRRLRAVAPKAWIVAEKVLEPGEPPRDDWPIDGTTGYDFLNQVGGLFVDPHGEEALTRFYADFTGEPTDYPALLHDKKRRVLRDLLGSDVNRLAAMLHAVCERHRRHRDYTRRELHGALEEVIACLPVYRTYVRAESVTVSELDVRYVTQAVAEAKRRRPDIDGELLDFVRDILLLRRRGALEGELAMRLQQLTAAAMAKGAEDTAFYCYNRFVAQNEVGGGPGRFGVAPADFHRWAAATAQRWPRTLLATSTHDTKRSEDVRARLALLSEMPARWAKIVRRWSAMSAPYAQDGMPDRNAEYLLWQTLLGAWPIEGDRLWAYMRKAAREAKVYTSWIKPDEAYEAALGHFVASILEDGELLADVALFVSPLVDAGRTNALAQTMVKLTAPGVPDFYQGSDLWDLSLVDPDNRRPVDYDLRRQRLEATMTLGPEAVLRRSDEGLPKLWVVHHGLRVRRERAGAVGPHGGYEPIVARGRQAEHLLAFMRGGEIVTVVPRLVLGLGGAWEDTEIDLPRGSWRNEMTGEAAGGTVRVGQLLARFPVALLTRERGP